MADIFISYSSADKSIVKILAAFLESKGWSVWWDRLIPIGEVYDTVIERELHNASCVLVIWTTKSVSSDWVRNEADDAARRGVLVPVVLEPVAIPLAFKRIESAMLIGWKGEEDHPELELLINSITSIIKRKHDQPDEEENGNKKIKAEYSQNKNSKPFHQQPDIANKPKSVYGIITVTGLLISMLLLSYYLKYIQGKVTEEEDQRIFYVILLLFGIAASTLVFGIMNSYKVFKDQKSIARSKIAAPAVGVILIVMGGFYLPPKSLAKNITVRVFDWKKNALVQGDVKIYLKEYIRTQSIDKMGQALFTGIPDDINRSKIKVEVSSPGYATCSFDTVLSNSSSLELTLPLTTVVFISGKVKTASEMPIRNVEINVEGTRYYAVSITDGSYNLRLEEYTLGDEITLTTSHKDYEDKTISLKINSPDIKNQDIFLNPISH
jgi:hypothetical protein